MMNSSHPFARTNDERIASSRELEQAIKRALTKPGALQLPAKRLLNLIEFEPRPSERTVQKKTKAIREAILRAGLVGRFRRTTKIVGE